MKKGYAAAVAALLVLSLAACQSREPISPAGFREHMENLGHEVVDVSERYDDDERVVTCLSMVAEGFSVILYEVDSVKNGKDLFENNKRVIEGFKSDDSPEKNVKKSAHQKYGAQTDETYYVTARIGATVLFAYCELPHSEALDRMIEDLGY